MTVAELIEKLQTLYPGNARVILHGYEGGYEDISDVVSKPIMLNVNEAWYYGDHDDPKDKQQPDEIAFLIR